MWASFLPFKIPMKRVNEVRLNVFSEVFIREFFSTNVGKDFNDREERSEQILPIEATTQAQ